MRLRPFAPNSCLKTVPCQSFRLLPTTQLHGNPQNKEVFRIFRFSVLRLAASNPHPPRKPPQSHGWGPTAPEANRWRDSARCRSEAHSSGTARSKASTPPWRDRRDPGTRRWEADLLHKNMVENQRWFSLFFHVENHHFDGPKGLEMRFLAVQNLSKPRKACSVLH